MIVDSQNKEYRSWVEELKILVRSTQSKTAVAVNRQLLELYWQIGRSIAERTTKHNWGKSVVELLSVDLMASFPGVKGFSRSNLFSMKQWFEFYHASKPLEQELIQQLVGQIPWGHNIAIVSKSKSLDEALRQNCRNKILNR